MINRPRHLLLIGSCALVLQTELPAAGAEEYKTVVKPFFKKYCIACHGPEKSKGEITLHTLDGAFELEQDLERWEDVL